MCGQPHTTPALPLGKMPSINWTGSWMGQRFGLEALKKWKISWSCQEPNLNYSFIYAGHRPPTTPTALSQLPYYSQSYPEYMCYSCNRLCTAATSHLGRNEYKNNNMKMDYSKMETMTKMVLTCSLQLHVLFSYKLCACHTTGYIYIQALFRSGCAPCTNWS